MSFNKEACNTFERARRYEFEHLLGDGFELSISHDSGIDHHIRFNGTHRATFEDKKNLFKANGSLNWKAIAKAIEQLEYDQQFYPTDLKFVLGRDFGYRIYENGSPGRRMTFQQIAGTIKSDGACDELATKKC